MEVIFDGFYTYENYLETYKKIYVRRRTDTEKSITEIRYSNISDILDAFFNGVLHNGIIENRQTGKKVNLPGHGTNYYSSDMKQFAEIVAQFSVLLKLGETQLLKETIGEEAYNMINDYYHQNILGITKENNKGVKR